MTPPIVGWDEDPDAYWARQARGTGGTPRDTNGRSPAAKGTKRARWDPRQIEAMKRLLVEVPKRERPPETIRVSLVPVGAGYADVRVYRGGLPTRQGLVIHRDLLPAILAALTNLADETR